MSAPTEQALFGAEHDGGRAGAGDAERHHRDERADGAGVVRRFWGRQPYDFAFTELLGLLRPLLLVVVGHESRYRTAGSGKDADEKSDGRLAQNRRQAALELSHCDPDAAEFGLYLDGRLRLNRLHILEDLAQAVDADDDDDDVDAGLESREAEGEAYRA